jgi:MYXO-CTERM domain-containing protein
LTQSGIPIGDPTADGANSGHEIVGDSANPAAFVYSDGNDFFARLRLDVTPLQAAANLRPFGWGVLIDNDNNFSSYEYAVIVDGIAETINFLQNTTPSGVGDPTDQAETPIGASPYPLNYSGGGNVRVVLAPTTFNGDQDFFLDFAIPVADMLSAGLNLTGPLTFWAGSSNTTNSLTGDLANLLGTPGPGSLPVSASDQIVLIDVGGEETPVAAPAVGGLLAAGLAAVAALRRRRSATAA